MPRLELVAGTVPWRANPGNPFPAYDLWDRIESERQVALPGVPTPVSVVQKLSAAPDGAYTQLRATLENRLDAGPAGQLRFQIGQDLDVRGGRLAESSASLEASKGPFTADALARFLPPGTRPPLTPGWKRSWLDAFTRLRFGAAVHDGRGDALRASLDSTGSGAVGAQGAGVDALFDLRPSGTSPDAWMNASARVTLGGAAIDYNIKLAGRENPAVRCSNGRIQTLAVGRPAQQTAVLTWDSPCHCFTARIGASLDACDDTSLSFDVDLSKILQGASKKGG